MPIGDYAQEASALRRKVKLKDEQLAKNDTLNEYGKSQALAAEWWAAHQRTLELREQHDRAVSQRREQLERELFGTTGEMDGSEAIAFRDAIDRTSQLKSEDQANRLMRQATMTNDRTLIKALFFKGVQHDWDDVVVAYTEAHPDAKARIYELEGVIRDQSTRGRFAAASLFILPRPKRLAAMSMDAIERAAIAARA